MEATYYNPLPSSERMLLATTVCTARLHQVWYKDRNSGIHRSRTLHSSQIGFFVIIFFSRFALCTDCRHLVTTGSDGTAKLWDTTTWELTETLENDKWVWDAAFCADSSYLVTASSDHVARLWNLRTGDVVRKYHGHQSSVTCVALNDSSV